MHGRSHRKTVCLSNSEAGQRYTPRKKGWDIRDMRRSTVHQKLGRDTHPERKGRGVSWVRRSALWRCVNHAYRTVLLGLFYLWPIVLFLPSTWLVPGSSSRGVHSLWVHVHAYYRVGHPPFSTPKKPSCTCADRGIFLDLRSGYLIS